MGPETTAEFYLQVVFGCQKIDKVQRPSVVVASVPMPFDVEREMIANNVGKEKIEPLLIREAKRLEKAGVNFIVMPCNSLHVFIKEIRSSVAIPVLSIVEETVKYLKNNGLHNVGLVSTSATLENRVYEEVFDQNAIKYETPDDLQKVEINKIIQRLVDGHHKDTDREELVKIINNLADRDVDCVALACTDLQLLRPKTDKVQVFDTMKVLADATIRELTS